MPLPDEINELRSRADIAELREKLQEYPNVHAVGIGYKYRNGKPTAKPSLMAFVDEKVPESELSEADIIPPEVGGIDTDVYPEESPEEQLMRGPARTQTLRPVPGGARHAREEDGGSTNMLGTLGGSFIDSDGDKVVLLSGHAASDSNDVEIADMIGRGIYQPTYSTSRPNNGRIGVVKHAEYDALDGSDMDYATVKLDNESWFTNEVLGVGPIGEYREPSFGEALVISGSTHLEDPSGLRRTYLTAVDVYANGCGPCFRYNNVTNGGDSGALVGTVDPTTGVFHPCALHILSGSYGLDLSVVMERAGLSVDDSGTEYAKSDVSGAAYFEGCVTNESTSAGTVTAVASNLGGEYGMTMVDMCDKNGHVIDSRAVIAEPLDQRRVELSLPDGNEYTLQTRDVYHVEETISYRGEFESGVYQRNSAGEWVRVQ